MSLNKKFNFTKKILESLIPHEQNKQYFYDLKVSGLAICITKNNIKTFYLYRKVQGRPERIRIGRFPDLSIENARGEASKLNHLIEKGISPNNEKNKIKNE